MGQQPVVLMRGREVRCAYCRTDEWGLPAFTEDDQHFSVRFDDFKHLIGKVKVTLDGVDVTANVMEAHVSGGWVGMFVLNDVGQKILCQYGKDHVLVEKKYGKVRVQRTADSRAR